MSTQTSISTTLRTGPSVPEVLASAQRAVEEYGTDWIDPNASSSSCDYTYEYEGDLYHCLAGWIALDLEPEAPWANTWEDNGGASALATELQWDSRAGAVIEYLQGLQDRGWTWGKAVAAATKKYGDAA